MELEQSLQKVGLSPQEAKLYVTALKLGTSKASDIALKANIKREACYYIMRLLQEKGFISEVIKGGIKHYSAVAPKRILELLDEEREQKQNIMKNILSDLESLQKTALARPKIEFYTGEEGLKTAASIMTQRENQLIYCYVSESILHHVEYFHPMFRRRRKEKNVRLRVISEKTDFMIKDLEKKDKEELRETKFNSDFMKGMDCAFYILPEGIIILKANDKEQLGIYIEEPSTAKLQRRIFEKLWKESK